MAAVIFQDGSLMTAPTWQDLETALRGDAWNPSNKGDFREEMAQRAWNWSGSAIHTEGSSKRLFRELEAAGLLMVLKEEK